MEVTERADLTGKLISVLRKITECERFDSIYTEKFLVNFSEEFTHTYDSIIEDPEFSKWLSGILLKWKQISPGVSEAIFVCKFCGILIKNQKVFEFLLQCGALTSLDNFLQSYAFDQTALTPVYIGFLSDALTHISGYEWVKNTKQWESVCRVYVSNSNLYIDREGLNFLKIFISKVTLDEDSSNVLQEIFLPIIKYNEINLKDKKFSSLIFPFLNLIQSLLENQIFNENLCFSVRISNVFDIQAFLNFLLENCEQEIFLEKASILQVMLFAARSEEKNKLLSLEDPSVVTDCFNILLSKKHFNGVIKLAKCCQFLWNKIRKKLECENKTEVFFISVQLLPALMCALPNTTDHIYIQNLYSLNPSEAQKFCDSFRDQISNESISEKKNLALKGILSIISSTESINSEEALLVFQAMTSTLKSFAADDNGSFQLMNDTLVRMEDFALLSGVLNVLCIFMEKFKIKWSESLESLKLIKTICGLLENINLPAVVAVQGFLLLKLIILSLMPPLLLLNEVRDSSFDLIMSLLFKRLHDPSWEIRDSCLEVVTAISEQKFPAFEKLLVEKKFYSLVSNIMEEDSESYVRASAIQALTAMIKVETLRKFLIGVDVPYKIMELLQNESEAIVRREAALLIKEIYVELNDSNNEIAKSFYGVMGYSAVCDLHWEVKVNSLMFWEAVIQRTIADQATVNEHNPNSGFSTEEHTVNSRLDKVLTTLSETGCLYVLMSTLNDDCDMPVIQKSAQIIAQLMVVLNCDGVIKSVENNLLNDRISMKRKNMVPDLCEKRKTTKNNYDSSCEINSESIQNREFLNSDVVIDEIVNNKDINLLGDCFQKDRIVILQKKILLQEVKPEIFLSQMENFNLEKFLEEKQKLLVNIEVDFRSIVNDNATVNFPDETNVMDCY